MENRTRFWKSILLHLNTYVMGVRHIGHQDLQMFGLKLSKYV